MNASHADRSAWLWRQAGGLALAAGVLLWLFESHPLDLQVAGWFYDATRGGFPHRHEWLFDSLLHHGLKSLSVAAGLGAAGLAIAGAAGLWPDWPRRNALLAVLGMALIPLGTALLKHWTHRHCPWDLAPFGGFVPYTTLLQGAPDGYAPGQCFPAGHAAGGFVWMVWGVALRRWKPRLARWALAGGMALGLLMGVARMAQGAHFLSHTLWSAWFGWAVIVGLAAVCRVEVGARGLGSRTSGGPQAASLTSACS